MTDDLGRKLDESLNRSAAGTPPNLVDVVERGRRIKRKRAVMNGVGLLTAVAVGWAAMAMPWKTGGDSIIVGPGPTPSACEISEGSSDGRALPSDCKRDQRAAEPTPNETRTGYVVGSKKVVMAFDSDGDIWLALSDGSTVNVTQSPETEMSPTISFDDEVLVYERRNKFSAGTLIYHRLTTGETAEFAHGSSPAFGPLDYLAWDSGRGEVVVGSPFSDWSVRAPNGPAGEGATSFSFAWDQSLELLHYEVAFGHGVNPYSIDIQRVNGWECSECGGGLKLGKVRSLQPDDGTEGEFLSTSFGTSVDVLRVCCRENDHDPWNDDPWETAEIGGLDPFDTGTTYNRIRDLGDVPLDLSGSYLGLAHAGSLEATVKGDAVEWRVTDRMAWFLVNGSDLWLLTDGRDPVLLPYKVTFGTVAVAPTFARSPLIHSF